MSDEWLDEMGMFVVNFSLTPAEYWALTLEERNAIVRAWNIKQSR